MIDYERPTALRLVALDGPQCHYCRALVGIAGTVDHVRPKALGGKDRLCNAVLACRACNTRKGAASYYDFHPTGAELPVRVRNYLAGWVSE